MKEQTITTDHNTNKGGRDFMKAWRRELIKHSKEEYADYLYRHPHTNDVMNVPKNKSVAILGYNSGRFDANLIYKDLHNPPECKFFDTFT
jgi:hypothetical protein